MTLDRSIGGARHDSAVAPTPTDRPAPSSAGVLRITGLALLWGSGFLWIKIGLRGFNPVQLVFGRMLLGFATLVPIALWQGLHFPRGRRVWAHLLVAALLANAIPYVLVGFGEQTVGSNVAGAINATTPLWTLLLGILLGTDRSVTPSRAAGFGLGLLGVVVIFAPWRSANEIASWGGAACLGAAASYSIAYLYMARFLTNRGIPPMMLSVGQLAAGTAALTVALPVTGHTAPTWRMDAVVSLTILGVLGTGAAYVLNYRIIQDEGPAATSAVMYLLPVVAVLLGSLAVDETVTTTTLAGIALVLGGVGLTRRRPQQPATRSGRDGTAENPARVGSRTSPTPRHPA